MPQTPNHGYNVPNEGEEDWHEPLNENFEQYDTDIEIRDVGSNLTDYDPKDGAKFFATDSGVIALGDGSNWRALPTTGQSPTFSNVDVSSTIETGRMELWDRSSGRTRIVHFTESGGAGHPRANLEFDESDNRWQLRLHDGDRFYALVAMRDGSKHVGIGTETPSAPLDVRGRNNWNVDNSDGDLRIGNDDYRLAMGVALGGGGAGACNIRAKGGIEKLSLGAGTSGSTLAIEPDTATVEGDLSVTGNKNFVQSVDTDDGEKEVVYTSREAPTPRTEVSGVAQLDRGRTEIDLPDHFGWVTDADEPIHVQTTPYSADSGGLAVVERSTDRLVVEDLDGEGDYEFSYTVSGARDGHADSQVVREPGVVPADGPEPSPADD